MHGMHLDGREVLYQAACVRNASACVRSVSRPCLITGCGMCSAAKFELRVAAGTNAPFTGMFAASSVGVMRCAVPAISP